MKLMIKEMIVNTAESGLELQSFFDGTMPSGSNGPWQEKKTPLRNTAHWSLVFLEAYKITSDKRFLDAVKKSANYLVSSELRPGNAAFICRIHDYKDSSNGLIGQAWVLEALLKIGREIKDERLIEIATENFNLHEFDHEQGLWKILESDGSIKEICKTINQQIWFAYAAIMLYKTVKNISIKNKIDSFFHNLNKNLEISNDGKIRHLIRERNIKRFKQKIIFLRDSRHIDTLEYGYHSFNMHGLAHLYSLSSDHSYWEQQKTRNILKKILFFAESKKFKENILLNKFSLAYNPTGFEVAYFFLTFKSYLDIHSSINVESWIKLQLDLHYNKDQALLNSNTLDEETLSARIYQLVDVYNVMEG